MTLTPHQIAELRALAQREAKVMERAAAQCVGKQKFPTPADARRSIRPRLRKIVEVYRCPSCGSFHAGGISRNKRLALEWRRRRRIV